MIGDIIFRNESDNVIRKFRAKEARSKQTDQKRSLGILSPSPSKDHNVSPDDASEAPSEEPLELVQQVKSPLSIFSLATNIEDQATSYFVTNWVVSSNQSSLDRMLFKSEVFVASFTITMLTVSQVNVVGPTRGYLDGVANMSGDDGTDVGLLAGMKAVGLAGFAHANRAPSLFRSARYHYVQALAKTNAALRSPLHVKKDGVLSSIMVLSLFEAVTGSKHKSLSDWAEHVKGATALLKLRGIEQLSTPRGRRMFMQVASSLMINCLQQERPLPPFIIEWTKIAKSHLSTPDPAFVAQEVMMKFTMLRASVHDGSLSDLEVILARALELDGTILSVFASELPAGWEYQTIYTAVNADWIYNGCYHIYYDHWISQMWNSIRTLRAMLNEMIRGILLKGFSCKPPVFTEPEHAAQYQISTNVLYELQADILATVPQHLGYVSPKTNSELFSSTDGSLVRSSNSEQFPTVRLSSPYFLVWPLWFAGMMDVATEEVKTFVVRNLRALANTTGIQQALVLANLVEAKDGITSW